MCHLAFVACLIIDDSAAWLRICLFQHSQRSCKGQRQHEMRPTDDQYIKGVFAVSDSCLHDVIILSLSRKI